MKSVIRIQFKKTDPTILFDKDLCTGCGSCELMCVLFREGEGGPAKSRCHIDRDPFNAEYHFHICQQCLAPSCYVACPLQGIAQMIDPETGVRYIDEEECIGCQKCIQACPFDGCEIKFNTEKKKSYTCDLCQDRKEGPVCVEYCPSNALTIKTSKKEGRK